MAAILQEYKGYIGMCGFSEDEGLYVGKVANCNANIVYGGLSSKELSRLFKDAIDTYITACKVKGTKPEKPLHPTQQII